MTVVSTHKDAEALTLTFVAEFDAGVERVWQVWQDPRQLERWRARRRGRPRSSGTTSSSAASPATT